MKAGVPTIYEARSEITWRERERIMKHTSESTLRIKREKDVRRPEEVGAQREDGTVVEKSVCDI